jgi:hypothetical protein
MIVVYSVPHGHPEGKLRGPSALACLGKAKREACRGKASRSLGPNEVRGCLANARQDRWRVRGASLTLGKTGGG